MLGVASFQTLVTYHPVDTPRTWLYGFIIAVTCVFSFLLWASGTYLWAWKASLWCWAFTIVGYIWQVQHNPSLFDEAAASPNLVFMMLMISIGREHDKLKEKLSNEQ